MEGVKEKILYKCTICGIEYFEEGEAHKCYKRCDRARKCKHTNIVVSESFCGHKLEARCSDCNRRLNELKLKDVPPKYLKELYIKCAELGIIK